MELTKEKLTDALSLTRERVRVWVSENLSLQKLNNAEKKDRHPLPPLSHRKMGEGTENVAFRSFSQRFTVCRQSLTRERVSDTLSNNIKALAHKDICPRGVNASSLQNQGARSSRR